MGIFEAVMLGVLEGLTEFLPISSTGHLILASKLLGIEQTDVHKTFEVSIQLGSIMAVVFLYFKKLLSDTVLIKKLAVAFLPTGVLGFLLYKHIKALFVPETVVIMTERIPALFMQPIFSRVQSKEPGEKGLIP